MLYKHTLNAWFLNVLSYIHNSIGRETVDKLAVQPGREPLALVRVLVLDEGDRTGWPTQLKNADWSGL